MTCKIRSTIAVLAAAVSVMTVGFSAAPAGAAIGSMSAELTVGHTQPASAACQVFVLGQVRMTRPEAQGLIDSGHKVWVRLWGNDPISDDLLREYRFLTPAKKFYGLDSLWASSQGLAFRVYDKVPRAVLDEDHDPGPGGQSDEVYAGVRLLTPDARTTIRSVVTNQVGGRLFGLDC